MTSNILEWLMEIQKKHIPQPGRVLDVGSCDMNGSPRTIFQSLSTEYIGIDVNAGPGVDMVLNVRDISEELLGKFDLIICCEMPEHDNDPVRSVEIMRKLLKSPGKLIITSPSNGFPLHRYPRDYWRLMPDVYEDIFFKDMKIIEHKVTSDPCSCYLGVLPK